MEQKEKNVADSVELVPWMKVCAFKCKRCGDVLKREYKSPNDYGGGMMTCTCGHLTLDPSPSYWRVFGEDVENLCEAGK